VLTTTFLELGRAAFVSAAILSPRLVLGLAALAMTTVVRASSRTVSCLMEVSAAMPPKLPSDPAHLAFGVRLHLAVFS